MSEQVSWQSLFVGRETEMALMQTAWQKAKLGDPQFVVLLAETGMGKTRLVQQFYHWLSSNENAEGYWPDILHQDDNSLRVNPCFDEGCVQEGIPPWLWWGIRFQNPKLRNQMEVSGCGLVAALPHLSHHFIGLQRKKELLSESRDLSLNFLTALGGILGFATLGPIAGAVVSGISVVSAVKDVASVVQNGQQLHHLATEDRGLFHSQQKEKQNAIDAIYVYFETLFSGETSAKVSLPFVLVLDDAQWADPDTLSFVEKLYRQAKTKNWPLLVLCTHWEKEWHESDCGDSDAHTDDPCSVVEIVKRNPSSFSPDWQPCLLGKVGGDTSQYALDSVVQAALPGITQEQRARIVKRVEGNPGFLHDLLSHLVVAGRRLFVKRDVKNALTASGEEKLDQLTDLTHFELNRLRFNSLDEELQDLLVWSSYQGMRFVNDVALEVAKRMLSDDGVGKEILQKANKPHAIIESITQLLSEFRQRSIYEIAHQVLEQSDEEHDELKTHLYDTLMAWRHGELLQAMDEEAQLACRLLLIGELEKLEERDNEQNVMLGDLYGELIRYFNGNHEGRQLAELATRIINNVPANGWAEEQIQFEEQLACIQALENYAFYEEALGYLETMILLLKNSAITPKNQEKLFRVYKYKSLFLSRLDAKQGVVESYEDAVSLGEELYDQFGEAWDQSLQMDLIQLKTCHGSLLDNLGKKTEALQAWDSSFSIQEPLSERLKQNGTYGDIVDLLRLQKYRANILLKQSNPSDALKEAETIIEIAEALMDHFGAERTRLIQECLENGYFMKSQALSELDRYEEALAAIDSAINRRRNFNQLFSELYTEVQLSNELANHYESRAMILSNMGQLEEEVEAYDTVIELQEDIQKASPDVWDSRMQEGLASNYDVRSGTLEKLDRPEDALEGYIRSIELREVIRANMKELCPENVVNNISENYINIAVIMERNNALEEAVKAYKHAIDYKLLLRDQLAEKWNVEYQLSLVNAYNALALSQADLSQFEQVRESSQRAIKFATPLLAELKTREVIQALVWAYRNKIDALIMLDVPSDDPDRIKEANEAYQLAEGIKARAMTEGYAQKDLEIVDELTTFLDSIKDI